MKDAQRRICFVISPIGDPESEIREQADDLFDLVVEPALRPYNFEVVRADKIKRPGVITSDIIQLVQNADLCIIDLTGSNPNVFYECGRRHETAKPFIQVLKQGEKLPFDLAGIRTVFYDLTSARSANAASEEIRLYVQELEQSGFAEPSSGESLSSLAAAVDRIERKVSRLLAPQGVSPSIGVSKSLGPSLGRAMRNPRESFMQAVASGDMVIANALLPRLQQMLPPKALAAAAAYVADNGSEQGARILLEMMDEGAEEIDYDTARVIVASLITYFGYREDPDGESTLVPFIDDLLGRELPAEDRAWLSNQKGKYLYSLEKFDDSAVATELATQLNPTDAAYYYNLSLIHEKRGDPDKTLEMVEKYMNLPPESIDADHLAHAVEVYFEQNRHDESRDAFTRLTDKDAGKANLLVFRNLDLAALMA